MKVKICYAGIFVASYLKDTQFVSPIQIYVSLVMVLSIPKLLVTPDWQVPSQHQKNVSVSY